MRTSRQCTLLCTVGFWQSLQRGRARCAHSGPTAVLLEVSLGGCGGCARRPVAEQLPLLCGSMRKHGHLVHVKSYPSDLSIM